MVNPHHTVSLQRIKEKAIRDGDRQGAVTEDILFSRELMRLLQRSGKRHILLRPEIPQHSMAFTETRRYVSRFVLPRASSSLRSDSYCDTKSTTGIRTRDFKGRTTRRTIPRSLTSGLPTSVLTWITEVHPLVGLRIDREDAASRSGTDRAIAPAQQSEENCQECTQKLRINYAREYYSVNPDVSSTSNASQAQSDPLPLDTTRDNIATFKHIGRSYDTVPARGLTIKPEESSRSSAEKAETSKEDLRTIRNRGNPRSINGS
ncbi:hypothetical protein NHQ30_011404 [Ciborinia camelliae]|nr:hypothetical protein NHQ30_011404 [Ciborinia camelliae]